MAFASLKERVKAFENSDIYAVVTSQFCGGRTAEYVVEQIGLGGGKIVQIREKDLDFNSYLNLAKKCRAICDKYNMLLIVDDNVQVAILSNADGVHLGQSDMPITKARALDKNLLIGSSTHNAGEIAVAMRDGASYLNIGPIFATQTKSLPMNALGLQTFAELKQLVKIPFSVMGGIKERHIKELCSLGAKHIAMVTEITQAENIAEKVKSLRRQMGVI